MRRGFLVHPETVSLQDMAKALNGFYSTYLERCILENEEFARGAEADCYRENCHNNDKVYLKKFSQFQVLDIYFLCRS